MGSRIAQRVFAGIRFVDAETQRPVTAPLTIKGQGTRGVRNASGLWVVTAAAVGDPAMDAFFEEYAAEPGPPPSPPGAPVSVEFSASDPSGRYLPRSFSIELPRGGEAKFTPVDVVLYPSPTARSICGSTVVRCSVTGEGGAPGAGVLLVVSVLGTDVPVAGRGLSDARGEALVLVPGVPLLRLGEEEGSPVVIDHFIAKLWAIPDPGSELVDPVGIELPTSEPFMSDLELVSGREHHVYVNLTGP